MCTYFHSCTPCVHAYTYLHVHMLYLSPTIGICMTIFNEHFDTGWVSHLTSNMQGLKIFLTKQTCTVCSYVSLVVLIKCLSGYHVHSKCISIWQNALDKFLIWWNDVLFSIYVDVLINNDTWITQILSIVYPANNTC